MYSTLWTCPTAVLLLLSNLALRTGHIFFFIKKAPEGHPSGTATLVAQILLVGLDHLLQNLGEIAI